MAQSKGLDEFEPIFGEATPELEDGAAFGGAFRRPFLFYAHLLDTSHLEILASDFHSHTFECVLTVLEIDDLRDETGIGGSWNDFVRYLLASLSTGDVKLILDGQANLETESSVAHANLVVRKSKGLPRISLPLNRLVNLSSKDGTANISAALFKAYKSKHNDIVKEQENSSRLKEMLSSERDRNTNVQKQLDALTFSSKRKVARVKDSEKLSHEYVNTGTNALVVSEADKTSASIANVEKPLTRDAQSLKGNQRTVPAFRRAKGRGASLQNYDEGDDGS